MKEKIIKLCSHLYWYVRITIERQTRYNYFFRISKFLSKNKNIGTDLLTKEQKLETDNFYKKHYGKKVPYMWHNLMVGYTDKFDKRYLPPKIFLDFVDKLNDHDIKYSIFYDKNFFFNFIARTGIKVPEKIFCSINGLFFDSQDKIISKQDLYKKISDIGEAFIKPTLPINSGYANNCRLINVHNGIDINSDTSIQELIEKNYTDDFVVQKKIVCHKSISDIYPNSVNTFSVHSFILNNEVKIINKFVFKIGMNGSVTDFSKKEGLIIAVNQDGILADSALCVKRDKNYLKKEYFSHPDTGAVFKNHRIENFYKVAETIKKIHALIPWLKFCKWDVTIDVDGNPLIIEAERPTELFQQQIIHKEGFFGEYTEEILNFLKNNGKE